MNVLIICENFHHDMHILVPIVRAMCEQIGKPNARILPCMDPHLSSISEATKWENIAEIIDRYKGMTQLFLLLVDRDGEVGRRDALNWIEAEAAKLLGKNRFFAENAHQEIEAWVLAGHDLPNGWRWPEIRAEIHVKERFFEPFATSRRLEDDPGGGRRTLSREAARNYTRIRTLCEEVTSLESRLAAAINAPSPS